MRGLVTFYLSNSNHSIITCKRVIFVCKVNSDQTYPHSSFCTKAGVSAVEHVYVLVQNFPLTAGRLTAGRVTA